MQERAKTEGKPELCRKCKNPGCPKCGTTHGMWECIAPGKTKTEERKNENRGNAAT